MTDSALPAPAAVPGRIEGLDWRIPAAIAIAVLLFLLSWQWPMLADYPTSLIIPFKDWVAAVMTWLKGNLLWLTRSVTAAIDVPLRFAFDLLARGFKFGTGEAAWTLPRLSWLGVTLTMGWLGYLHGGVRLALLCGLGFLALALFGVWDHAMLTLALIIICVPFCVVTGLLIGIWGSKSPASARWLITPALDLMQTIPTFAYLIPMLLLFGASPVSALLATGLFATPPMVRATMLGLTKVPQEIRDFADMAGCTRAQKLWRVLIPAAKPSLMLGVNQVIMLALNMVIISSMIGAGGLGYDVLLALRALKIGQAMEAGLAIVIIAIVLDRLSQAIARRNPETVQAEGVLARHGNLLVALAVLAGTTLLALAIPALDKLPAELTVTTAPYWKAGVDWVTQNLFDVIEAGRVALLLYFLNPLRWAFENLPWAGALLIVVALGWRLGGWGLAVIVGILTAFCVTTGLWVPAMQTLYLAGASTLVACLIGMPIGLWASRSNRVDAVVTPVIDTLQTIPSFCFIIPVVMLFRVGDVTAMIATVAFAVVPAIRYTNHGIRQVPQQLIEAGRVSGCTRWQLFRHVQLPVALPEIMLGINQTILLALSMIIICAMIGTRDLGQEIFKALSKADSGRGIVAGLVIAFIGIIADRLITAWVARMRAAGRSMSAEARVKALSIWKGLKTVVPLKGGVSNASFTVTDEGGKYVARVGEDYPFHQVSREREAIASRAAFDAGLSPEVVHTAPGIMVVRHLEARTYEEADVRANAAACIDIVKRCHRDMGRRIGGQGAIFWVFQILRDYAHTLKAGSHPHVPDLPRLMAIVDELEAAQAPLPIIFGHHDLLPTNFMDDGQRLWLIDWEYGAFGTAMFDLANIASNNSFDVAGERLILDSYFGTPSAAVERAFHAMKAASAMREAVWGMISELHLAAPGVDYMAYAAEYLRRFETVYADYKKNFA